MLSLRLLLLGFDAFIIFVIFGGVDGIFESHAVWNKPLRRSRFISVGRCGGRDRDGLVKLEQTLLALLYGIAKVEHRIQLFDDGSLKFVWLRREVCHYWLEPGA